MISLHIVSVTICLKFTAKMFEILNFLLKDWNF